MLLNCSNGIELESSSFYNLNSRDNVIHSVSCHNGYRKSVTLRLLSDLARKPAWTIQLLLYSYLICIETCLSWNHAVSV